MKEKRKKKLHEENLYEKYKHPCKYRIIHKQTYTHILNHISKSINVLETIMVTSNIQTHSLHTYYY